MQKCKLTITLSTPDYTFLEQKANGKDVEIRELVQTIIQTYILTSRNYPKVEMLFKGLFYKVKDALKPKQVQEAV